MNPSESATSYARIDGYSLFKSAFTVERRSVRVVAQYVYSKMSKSLTSIQMAANSAVADDVTSVKARPHRPTGLRNGVLLC